METNIKRETGGGTVSPPKQNTEEIGHWTTPVSDYHSASADAMLDYTYMTSNATRGLYLMDFITKFGTKPGSLFGEMNKDGWVKVLGGLPPEEYKKLVGAHTWESIENKYKDEKYLVYDNEQEKDPATQLYPEFELMFRNGCYIKLGVIKYPDDNQPKLTVELKSAKEMGK